MGSSIPSHSFPLRTQVDNVRVVKGKSAFDVEPTVELTQIQKQVNDIANSMAFKDFFLSTGKPAAKIQVKVIGTQIFFREKKPAGSEDEWTPAISLKAIKAMPEANDAEKALKAAMKQEYHDLEGSSKKITAFANTKIKKIAEASRPGTNAGVTGSLRIQRNDKGLEAKIKEDESLLKSLNKQKRQVASDLKKLKENFQVFVTDQPKLNKLINAHIPQTNLNEFYEALGDHIRRKSTKLIPPGTSNIDLGSKKFSETPDKYFYEGISFKGETISLFDYLRKTLEQKSGHFDAQIDKVKQSIKDKKAKLKAAHTPTPKPTPVTTKATKSTTTTSTHSSKKTLYTEFFNGTSTLNIPKIKGPAKSLGVSTVKSDDVSLAQLRQILEKDLDNNYGKDGAGFNAGKSKYMEVGHNFIQRMFPLKTPSHIGDSSAPTLSDADIAAFKTDHKAQAELRENLKVMMRYYGFTTTTKSDGSLDCKIDKSPGWEKRQNLWTTINGAHNLPRMSRILECLVTLGLTDEAKSIKAELDKLCAHANFKGNAKLQKAKTHWDKKMARV